MRSYESASVSAGIAAMLSAAFLLAGCETASYAELAEERMQDIVPEREIPTFDVHFAILTEKKAAQRRASLEQLKEETDILNAYFVSESGEPIIRFQYKSMTPYEEVKASGCRLAELADVRDSMAARTWAAAFMECDDPKVRDPYAINFYVYDAYSRESDWRGRSGFGDISSRGFLAGPWPFVLMDWERLGHTEQAPEEHEMGHAFGLGHVCVPYATRHTSTNIMASTEDCPGSGGKRNIGFNEEQVETILNNVALIQRLWNRMKERESPETS